MLLRILGLLVGFTYGCNRGSKPPAPVPVPPLPDDHIFCLGEHYPGAPRDKLSCGFVDPDKFDNEDWITFAKKNPRKKEKVVCEVFPPNGTDENKPDGPYRPNEFLINKPFFLSSEGKEIAREDSFYSVYTLDERWEWGRSTDKGQDEHLFWYSKHQDNTGRKHFAINYPMVDNPHYQIVPVEAACMRKLERLFDKASYIFERYGPYRWVSPNPDLSNQFFTSDVKEVIGWLVYYQHPPPSTTTTTTTTTTPRPSVFGGHENQQNASNTESAHERPIAGHSGGPSGEPPVGGHSGGPNGEPPIPGEHSGGPEDEPPSGEHSGPQNAEHPGPPKASPLRWRTHKHHMLARKKIKTQHLFERW